MSQAIKYEPGTKFGYLTVIRYDGVHKKPCGTTQGIHLCKCECGKNVRVLTQNLKNGNTISCGCYEKKKSQDRRLPNNQSAINQLILQYKRHAKDRNIEWNLSDEDFAKLIHQPCYYCGEVDTNLFKNKYYKNGYAYNGIDRINSNLGYQKDNVVSSCKICNNFKLDMSIDAFFSWIKKIYKYKIEPNERNKKEEYKLYDD